MAPGTIENAARFYGGGVASFTLDTLNAVYARQSIERQDMDTRRLPFVKQLYGVIDDEVDRMAGYERLDKAQSKSVPFDRARSAGDVKDALGMLDKDGKVVGIGSVVLDIKSRLSDLRKAEIQVLGDTNISESQRYVKLLEISAYKRLVLGKFSKSYDELIRTEALTAKEKKSGP
jgi:hypothetical protein